MKTKNSIFILTLIVMVCICFTNCENPVLDRWWDYSQDDQTYYTVTFISGREGDAPVPDDQQILPGQRASEPQTMSRVLTDEDRARAIAEAESTHLEIDPSRFEWVLTRWCRDEVCSCTIITGYDEDGNYNISYSNAWNFSNDTVTSDITLYANWEIQATKYVDTWNVIFDPNGGEPNEIKTIIVYDHDKLPWPPIVTKSDSPGERYGFAGWVTDGGQLWNFNQDIVTENMILYASWSALSEYKTVTFNANDGDPEPEPQYKAFGAKAIPPAAMAKENHTFGGWYTESGFINLYDFDTPVTDDIYLYAKWMQCTVYFHPDSGIMLPSDTSVTIAHGERISRPAITKVNMGFAGWYTDPGFTPASVWDFDEPVTEDISLYAKWEDPHFIIKFNLKLPNGTASSSVIPNQDIADNNKIIEPLADPETNDDGWLFEGWYYYDPPYDPGSTNYSTIIHQERDRLKAWDFDTILTNDLLPLMIESATTPELTLYARWVEKDPNGMIWVRKGSFTMGGPTGSGASPSRTVKLTSGFYINPTEVTRQEYQDVLNWGKDKNLGYVDEDINLDPSNFKYTSPGSNILENDLPVEKVSWYDAVFFCNVLTSRNSNLDLSRVYDVSNITRAGTPAPGTTSAKAIINADVTVDWTRSGYRLPTEAEWEYAARGGYNQTDYVYAGSNDANDVAWYTQSPGATGTRKVRTKMSNSLGIFDMSGNVYEWCWDFFGTYSGRPNPEIDPRGPVSAAERVRRGGCWNNVINNIRNISRESAPPSNANWVIGFRYVRGPTMIY